MPRACKVIKKGTLAQAFCCEFCEIFKNIFLQNISGRLHLHVVINLYSWGCSVSCGKVTCITFSTNPIYSSLLSLVKAGALTSQGKEWMWGLPRIWNSARIALHFVFPIGPSITISIKNTSAQYGKYLATKTGLLFDRLHLSW